MNIGTTFGALCAITLCGACATSPGLKVPDAPESLRAPSGQVLALEALASGVQIYECAAVTDDAARFQWTFKGPEAPLTDRGGSPIGKHYRGPTWESNDGSAITAEVRASVDSPRADAIPLLLLNVKTTRGTGVFGKVRSIQRLETTGGRVPSEPCASSKAGLLARVPYTAAYYFYADGP